MAKPQSTGNLVNALAQDSSNNIGIGGAANASFKLQVTGATNLTGALSGTSASFSSSVGVGGATNTLGFLEVWKSGSAIAQLSIGQNATYHTDFFVDTTGNFYIQPQGTTRLTLNGSTGAATFSSSVKVPSSSTGGLFEMGSGANANSRSFRLASDVNDWGDFGIQVSNSQTGTTYTNALLINRSGNVGIGTSTITSIGSGYTTLDIEGTNGGGVNFGNGTPKGFIYADSGGVNMGTNSAIPYIFYTSATERMRITSGGDMLVGTTSTSGLQRSVTINGSSNAGVVIQTSGSNRGYLYSTGGSALYLETVSGNIALVPNSGSVVVNNLGTGLVYSNAGALTSTNPSDKRLKDNITDISWGLNDILKLRPVSYHWQDDKINQGVQFGFIAQEVQEVMPEAIKEFGQEVKYLGLEKDAIYATLVKAIQEQQAQIEELKALIAAK